MADENGLGMLAAKLEELETLRARNLDLEKGIHLSTMTIEALKREIAAERTNTDTAQAERDQAIAERAIFEALFASFRAQLEAFEVPAAILSPRTARALASGGVLGKDLPHTARWLGGAPAGEPDPRCPHCGDKSMPGGITCGKIECIERETLRMRGTNLAEAEAGKPTAELEEMKATVAEVKLPDQTAEDWSKAAADELEPPLEQFIPPKHRKRENRGESGLKHDSA